MVRHDETLPECVKEHENMRQIFYWACGFYLTFLCISVPIVIANVNDLKKDDVAIRREASAYWDENYKIRNEQTAERNRLYSDMVQRLTRIETKLDNR